MTYADLKARIARVLHRADLEDDIVNFITLVHADLDMAIMGAAREATVTLPLTNGRATLPDDNRGLLNVAMDCRPLLGVGRRDFDGLDDTPGEPCEYIVKGGVLEVYPPSSTASVDVTYRQALPALVEDEDTNFVLTRFPSLYLYGACMHSAPLLIEDDRIATWAALYQTDLAKANAQLGYEDHPAQMYLTTSGTTV